MTPIEADAIIKIRADVSDLKAEVVGMKMVNETLARQVIDFGDSLKATQGDVSLIGRRVEQVHAVVCGTEGRGGILSRCEGQDKRVESIEQKVDAVLQQAHDDPCVTAKQHEAWLTNNAKRLRGLELALVALTVVVGGSVGALEVIRFIGG